MQPLHTPMTCGPSPPLRRAAADEAVAGVGPDSSRRLPYPNEPVAEPPPLRGAELAPYRCAAAVPTYQPSCICIACSLGHGVGADNSSSLPCRLKVVQLLQPGEGVPAALRWAKARARRSCGHVLQQLHCSTTCRWCGGALPAHSRPTCYVVLGTAGVWRAGAPYWTSEYDCRDGQAALRWGRRQGHVSVGMHCSVNLDPRIQACSRDLPLLPGCRFDKKEARQFYRDRVRSGHAGTPVVLCKRPKTTGRNHPRLRPAAHSLAA